MKLKKILSITFGIAIASLLMACGSDDENTSPQTTDASLDFATKATYAGTFEPVSDGPLSGDITFSLERFVGDGLQAVTVAYAGTLTNSSNGNTVNVDQSAVFNVVKNGNVYLFVSATSSGTMVSYGRLEGNTLTFNVKAISSGKMSSASAAKEYVFKGVRQ